MKTIKEILKFISGISLVLISTSLWVYENDVWKLYLPIFLISIYFLTIFFNKKIKNN